MTENKMYQVSTLSALALGYTRKVIAIKDLLEHGDTGLGTFENVDGEMIVIDGHCYRASNDGSVNEPDVNYGTPFASVAKFLGNKQFKLEGIASIDKLKQELDLKIEEGFGLNSMHIVRIDAHFDIVRARSESAFRSQHIELKEILSGRQKDFVFEGIQGSLICLYYPDYMQGFNAAGWHFHFISEDRKRGGHVFDVKFEQGTARLDKICQIELQLPTEAAFDTYTLAKDMSSDIKKVEQGKNEG